MTYQTTYHIPWSEKSLMDIFDADEDMHCVKEDTIGRIYKGPLCVYTVNVDLNDLKHKGAPHDHN